MSISHDHLKWYNFNRVYNVCYCKAQHFDQVTYNNSYNIYWQIASTMFVTHGIPSFVELLRKCIYNFSQRISLSFNSIITACLTPSAFI